MKQEFSRFYVQIICAIIAMVQRQLLVMEKEQKVIPVIMGKIVDIQHIILLYA